MKLEAKAVINQKSMSHCPIIRWTSEKSVCQGCKNDLKIGGRSVQFFPPPHFFILVPPKIIKMGRPGGGVVGKRVGKREKKWTSEKGVCYKCVGYRVSRNHLGVVFCVSCITCDVQKFCAALSFDVT